jgi:hypothetical protein
LHGFYKHQIKGYKQQNKKIQKEQRKNVLTVKDHIISTEKNVQAKY